MPIRGMLGFGPELEAFLRARGSGAVVTISTTFGYRVTGHLWRLETRADGIVAVLTDVDHRFSGMTEIVRLADIESVEGCWPTSQRSPWLVAADEEAAM